jgi:hypothetical protein
MLPATVLDTATAPATAAIQTTNAISSLISVPC